MSKMRIGYTGNNYPEKRNIIDRVGNAEYVNLSKFNLYAYFNRINFWWRKFVGKELFHSDYYQYQSLMKPRVSGIHFFNSVSYSSTPFVTTFETVLPYFDILKKNFKHVDDWSELSKDAKVNDALRALASPSCKKILALSHSTKRIQEKVLENFPAFEEEVLSKLMVLHPPQACMEYSPRSFGGVYQLVFVGRAFYRKGGQELIHALSEIEKEFPIHVHIVSSLDVESGWPGITVEQLEEDRNWLKNQTWISFHNSMSNDKLLRLFDDCHLGFLPTWQDTYGYSVLEMQSRGCPVVTTQVRSLPEINPLEVGWQIEHPTNDWGEWLEIPMERESQVSHKLAGDLYVKIKEILSNPQAMEAKGRAAVERIKLQHSPEKHAAILSDLYQRMFEEK